MRGVPIYAADCRDFSTNGYGFLLPTECTVEEQANGLYELTLEQPITEDKRWSLAGEGMLLKARCPIRESPLYEADVAQAQTVTRDIYTVRTNGGRLRLRQEPSLTSTILSLWRPGTEVVKLAEAGDFYQVTIRDGGQAGYMWAGYLRYDRTISQVIETTQPVGREGVQVTIAREQLFRIYSVENDTGAGIQTIRALHVFYDLRHAVIAERYEPENAAAGAAAGHVLADGVLLGDNPFTLHCDRLIGTVSGLYDYCSPIEAWLDPDNGILTQAKGRLFRDNFDIFMLPDETRDMGVTIRRGKNLIGVDVSTDDSGVVTRIIPCGKTKNGDPLFLDGTIYVDSPRLADAQGTYRPGRAKKIDYDVKAESSSSSAIAAAREELRRRANQDFADGCDLPAYGLDVDFVMLGQDGEYADWARLQAVHMFDSVTIIDEVIGLNGRIRVTGYVWDVLSEKYVRMTLGDVRAEDQTVYSYNLPGGGISGSKIAPGTADGAILRNATLQYAKISIAAIEQLNANSVNAITARIEELIAQQITTDELYVGLATIAAAEITTANIQRANIDWAAIATLTAEIARVSTAQITTANIIEANIDWAQINSLNAQVAAIADAEIQNASITTAQIADLEAEIATVITLAARDGKFEFANIKDLLAQAMILEEGVAGTVYIRNLVATHANFVGAIIGDLVLQGEDGLYYNVAVQADGTIYAETVTLTEEEIAAGRTVDGREIVATTANIESLNAQNIKAESAIISDIFTQTLTAGKITASEAFLASATVPELYTTAVRAVGDSLDLTANESIRLMIEQATDIGGTNLIRIQDPYVTVRFGEIVNDGTDEPWRRSLHEFRMGTHPNTTYNWIRFEDPIRVHGTPNAPETYTLSFWAWTIEPSANLYVDDDFSLIAEVDDPNEVYALVDGDLTRTVPDDWSGPDYEHEGDDIIIETDKTLRCNLYNSEDGIDHYFGNASLQVGIPTYNSFIVQVNYISDVILRFVTDSPLSANSKIVVSDVKLERGSVPTAWSANPYDIYGKIDTQVTMLQGLISAKVSQETFDTLAGRVSTAEASLALVPGEISAAVKEITIGGTNLIRMSDGRVVVQKGAVQIGEVEQDSEVHYYDLSQMFVRIDAGTYSPNSPGQARFLSGMPPRPSPDAYTLSFWCWTDPGFVTADDQESPRIALQFYNGDGYVTVVPHDDSSVNNAMVIYPPRGTPQRYEHTFTITTATPGSVNLRFNVTSAWTDTTKHIYISDVKVEEGDKATGWSPHPEEVRSGSSFSLTKDATIIRTPVFSVEIQGDDDHFQLDEDGGVMDTLNVTKKLSAPNLAERYHAGWNVTVGLSGDFPTLSALAEALRNRTLDSNLTVTIQNDLTENVVLGGVTGMGEITIKGANHELTGTLALRNNACPLVIENFKMTGDVSMYGGYARFESCTFVGQGQNVSGSKALYATQGARAMLHSCEFYQAHDLISISHTVDISCRDLIGGDCTNFLYIDGGTAKLAGTRPAGSFGTSGNGHFVYPSDPMTLTVNSGSSHSAPTKTIHTDDFVLGSSETWYVGKSAWGPWGDFSTGTLMQGGFTRDGYCELAGVMWFDLSSIPGSVPAADIVSATLSLARLSGTGKAGDVNVHIYTTPLTSASGNPLTNSVDCGLVGVISGNNTLSEFALPVSAVTAIRSGAGLMLYVNDGRFMSGRGYSDNYCRYAFSGANAPVLTVTYKS